MVGLLRRINLVLRKSRGWGFIAISLMIAGCPDRRLSDARRLVEEGRFEEAGEAFERLARSDPANLAAWDGAVNLWCRDRVNVGRCMSILDLELELLGNLQRHRNALSEVLELRARARTEQGLLEAALADLARAEKAAPERASVFVARARVLMMRADREGMLKALRQARKLDPHQAEADALFREVPQAEEGFGGSPEVRAPPD